MIASFYCINTQNPERNKIDSHISSIFAEKETYKSTSDKVENKAEKEMKSEPGTGTSTYQEEKKGKTKLFPKLQNKCLLHFALTMTFNKLATIRLILC